jgi:WD40 repeat protein/energy-coupling factor transporter ATP-binding protein EcfA2
VKVTVQHDNENPFPGLRPFEQTESHLFFGRDGQSAELLNRLDRNRFLAVVGTSGSGKSSLVRAGLLPTVHGGFMAEAGSHWRVAIFRPGDSPIRNLAEALSRPGVLKAGRFREEEHDLLDLTVDTEVQLRRGRLGLVETCKQAPLPEGVHLLLVVDQFEELFRFKEESEQGENASDEAAAFVKLLLKATEQKDIPIYVVITMRSEFLGDCAQFRDLPEAINQSQYLIPRMTRAQRRRAITGPVAVVGARITPRLVQRLLNDVGDDPDQLPILQHALMRTWDFWDKRGEKDLPLDLEHYKAIGRMENALDEHAEKVYAGLKNPASRDICEKMFKLLTQKGERGRHVRRPAKFGKILSVTKAARDDVIKVINVFRQPGRAFLMPPKKEKITVDSMIDISHESLMQIWRSLNVWVEEEAKSAEKYLDLVRGASKKEQREGSWLVDPELYWVLKWWEEDKPTSEWAERYDSSFDEAKKFLNDSEEQKRIRTEQKEREQRAKRKWRRIYITLITSIAVIAVVSAFWAWDAKKRETKSRLVAVKERLNGDKERLNSEWEHLTSEFLRVKEELVKEELAKKTEEKKEAEKREEEAKRKAVDEKLKAIEAQRNERRKTIQKLISDMNNDDRRFGQYLAKAKELAVRSKSESEKVLQALLALAAYDFNSKAYDNLEKDTKKRYSEYESLKFAKKTDDPSEAKDLTRRYKTLQKNAKNRRLPPEIFEALRRAYIANESLKDILHPAESRALAVTRNNKIVFNNWEGEIKVSSLSPDSNDSSLPVLEKTIGVNLPDNIEGWIGSFAGTEGRLFCGTRGGGIIYWEGNDWEKSGLLVDELPGPVLSMVYSKNKSLLIYSVKNKVYRYDFSEKASKPVVETDGVLRAITLLEDEKNSLLIYADSNMYCKPLSSDLKEKGRLIGRFKSHIYAIAYSRTRKLLVVGSRTGKIHAAGIGLQHLEPGKTLDFYPLEESHNGIVRALAFSPDGGYLASNGMDGTIKLWKLGDNNSKGKKARFNRALTIKSKKKILSLVFDLSGKYIIFSDEQNLRICPTGPEAFYKKLCKRKEREFTDLEWNRYIGDKIKKEEVIICSSEKENGAEK